MTKVTPIKQLKQNVCLAKLTSKSSFVLFHAYSMTTSVRFQSVLHDVLSLVNLSSTIALRYRRCKSLILCCTCDFHTVAQCLFKKEAT